MLIRVRSNVGVWRVDGLDDGSATVQSILDKILESRPNVVYEKPLSRDPACTAPLDTSTTLADQGLRHGSMVHCRVDSASCAEISSTATSNMKRVIGEDGSIQMVHDNDPKNGFRKGQLALRDMKMQWTLNDFVAMDSQFEFKIKRQPEAICKGISLDTASVQDFQSYLRRFQFSRQRCGFLYGKFVEEGEGDEKVRKVSVEAIYEPPQEADPDSQEGFALLDDPKEQTVEKIAELLGLTKVGWIFGHPPREEGFILSSHEIILAAEFQLEAAEGVEETPFVTVKVTVGDDGNTSVEAFQVSQQCMQMVAEEALEVGPNPGFCVVNDTFSAIQEGKESKTVDNNFFLTVVPIVQHSSETFVNQFPKLNRDHDDRMPNKDELKRQLSKSGTAGWTFVDLLADFNLLVFLSQFLDLSTDMPKICGALVDKNIELDDGYKLIIKSIAGMDGSY